MEQPLLARKSEHLFTSLNTCPTRTCMNLTINFFCKNIIIGVSTLDILFGFWPYATFLMPYKREPKGGGRILRCRTKKNCKKSKARKYVQNIHNWQKKPMKLLKVYIFFIFFSAVTFTIPNWLLSFTYSTYCRYFSFFFPPLLFIVNKYSHIDACRLSFVHKIGFM